MFLLMLAYIFQHYTKITLNSFPNNNICKAYIDIPEKPFFHSSEATVGDIFMLKSDFNLYQAYVDIIDNTK